MLADSVYHFGGEAAWVDFALTFGIILALIVTWIVIAVTCASIRSDRKARYRAKNPHRGGGGGVIGPTGHTTYSKDRRGDVQGSDGSFYLRDRRGDYHGP